MRPGKVPLLVDRFRLNIDTDLYNIGVKAHLPNFNCLACWISQLLCSDTQRLGLSGKVYF